MANNLSTNSSSSDECNDPRTADSAAPSSCQRPARPRSVQPNPTDCISDEPDGDSGEKLLRVGDLAHATGKTVRALHLYEQMGLLRSRTRTKGHYRLFGSDAVVRIRWITKLQDLGMSLTEIARVLRRCEQCSGPGAMSRVRDVYEQQLQHTREQLLRLRGLERELSASLRYLARCRDCDSARVLSDCRRCHYSEVGVEAPDLVAGLSAQCEGLSVVEIPATSSAPSSALQGSRKRLRANDQPTRISPASRVSCRGSTLSKKS